jgi:hypothetical protein
MLKIHLFALLLCCGISAHAVDKSQAPVAIISENGKLLSVLFAETVSASGPQFKPEHIRLPSANPATARVASASQNFVQHNEVTLAIDPPIADPRGLQVCFDSVEFVEFPGTKQQKTKLSPGKVCVDVQTNVEEVKNAALADLKSVPKNAEEKTIFASGFVATASGGSAGGGDISLNPDLGIKGMTSFLNIKKNTQNNGDPKHFEAGARYQTVLPWARSAIRKMASAEDMTEMGRLLQQQQRGLIAGAIYDFAAKLEGEPTHFQVTNLVGDTNLSLRTMTKGFAGKHGFWRAYLLPLGFEGGRSLSQGQTDGTTPPTSSTSERPDWIARYKAGVGMSFFYDDWNTTLPFHRIELAMNGVGRNLFFKESSYNSETKTTDTTVKGVRAYGQVDLKLYVGQTDKARYGIKLSYNRGSLPPVFARVRSFQFGFLFETTDDKTKGK